MRGWRAAALGASVALGLLFPSVRLAGADEADVMFIDEPARVAFCATLKQLVAAAPGRFATVKGSPQERRDGVWKASVSIPGGQDCLVYDGAISAYACDLYIGDRSDQAAAAYGRTVALLRRCLPPGWTATERVDGTRTRTRAAGGSGGPAVRVVSGLSAGDAYLVDFWVDAPDR